MKTKKRKNPLIKRIPRELRGEWKKYLVVSLFLILTIGFVAGMYVANGSMMQAAENGKSLYLLENGHFELKKEADSALLEAIASGTKADLKQFYIDKARKELDEKFQDKAYPEAYDKAYQEAVAKLEDKIEEKYREAEEKYELNDTNFREVPVKLYENFFKNVSEDNNGDGVEDGTVRVYARTEDINLASILEGRFPETAEEIAIDRMHADNVGVSQGAGLYPGRAAAPLSLPCL